MAEKNCNGPTATPILLPLYCSMEIWDGGGRGKERERRSEAETGKKWWGKAILVFCFVFVSHLSTLF